MSYLDLHLFFHLLGFDCSVLLFQSVNEAIKKQFRNIQAAYQVKYNAKKMKKKAHIAGQ